MGETMCEHLVHESTLHEEQEEALGRRHDEWFMANPGVQLAPASPTETDWHHASRPRTRARNADGTAEEAQGEESDDHKGSRVLTWSSITQRDRAACDLSSRARTQAPMCWMAFT